MTTGLHPGSEVRAGTVLELWPQRSPGHPKMVLNLKVTKKTVRTPAKRVWPAVYPLVYTATGLPVSLLGKQWLGTDKSTCQQIPSGDGPRGRQSQEGEVAQPFLQPGSLGKSYKTTRPSWQNTNIPASSAGRRRSAGIPTK